MATQKEKRAARQKVSQFAFPKQRKEPVHDAEHVRNAIARFDQVEVEARDWPDLMTGGKARRRSLLTFKRGIPGAEHRRGGGDEPGGQAEVESTDLVVLRAEAARLERRLSFWQNRLAQSRER